jgi:hypothetical protein
MCAPQSNFECLRHYLWNLICISGYLIPPQQRTSQIRPISNTNITALQVAERNLAWKPAPIFMKFSAYIILHKAISTACLGNFPSVIPTLKPLKLLRSESRRVLRLRYCSARWLHGWLPVSKLPLKCAVVVTFHCIQLLNSGWSAIQVKCLFTSVFTRYVSFNWGTCYSCWTRLSRRQQIHRFSVGAICWQIPRNTCTSSQCSS